jgi:DNA invertase Pin-like site-specific DNA recombinase
MIVTETPVSVTMDLVAISKVRAPREVSQMRVGIYARTSTDDGRQELTNQTRELHAYSERMGWKVVGEYLDQVSGRKAERPQFLAAMQDARKRKFDVLLFWSLDRLSREGVLKTLLILNQLSGYGVKYRSLQEQWIDSLGAFSDAIVGVLATVAKFEADRMSARVRSGLERARAEGKVLGRPRAVLDRDKVTAMRKKGMSLREIATVTGKSAMTIQRILVSGAPERESA